MAVPGWQCLDTPQRAESVKKRLSKRELLRNGLSLRNQGSEIACHCEPFFRLQQRPLLAFWPSGFLFGTKGSVLAETPVCQSTQKEQLGGRADGGGMHGCPELLVRRASVHSPRGAERVRVCVVWTLSMIRADVYNGILRRPRLTVYLTYSILGQSLVPSRPERSLRALVLRRLKPPSAMAASIVSREDERRNHWRGS